MGIRKLDFYEWCDFNFPEVACGSVATSVVLVGIATLIAVGTQSAYPFWMLTGLVIPIGLTAIVGYGKMGWKEYIRQRAIERDRQRERRQ